MKWFATIRIVNGCAGPDCKDIQMHIEEVWKKGKLVNDGTEAVFGGNWYYVEVDDKELT